MYKLTHFHMMMKHLLLNDFPSAESQIINGSVVNDAKVFYTLVTINGISRNKTA